jgi:hypothetical protein
MILGVQHSMSWRGAILAGLVAAMGTGLACGGGGDGDQPPTGDADAYIQNANNYTSTSSLSIPSLPVKAGADLRVCWTGLTSNLLGHPLVDTKDIDSVTFLRIEGLTKAEIAQKFAADQFETKNVKIPRTFAVADHSDTCASLSQFKLGAAYLDPAADLTPGANIVLMLLWAKGTVAGIGSQTMAFLDADAGSTVTEVTAPQGKPILSFEADLTTPKAVDIPASGPWVIDWSGLTKTGMDQPVVYQKIDSILVGFYQDMSVSELEARCLDFDRIATKLYRATITPLGARSIDLATTKIDGGEAFGGFSARNGVWAVGLMCSQCKVPAPVAVAILNPI